MNAPPVTNDVVIRRLLIENAATFPADDYAHFEDGSVWTWSDVLAEVRGAASVLRQAGLRQGHRIAVMLPNGADYLRVWWAAAMLGGIVVPINPAYRGNMLAHLLKLAEPMALVTVPDYLGRFDDFIEARPDTIILSPADLRHRSQGVPDIAEPIEYWDVHAFMLTSGTTGVSKLSATTYLHLFQGGAWFVEGSGLGPDDRFLIDLPLFHLAAMYQVVATLKTRTQIVVRTRPELGRYWEIVRENRITVGLLLSTMVPYLLSQPPGPGDRDHSMRLLLSAPLPRNVEAFKSRFGIPRIRTAIGSTEVPGPIVSDDRDPLVHGYCGRARDGFEIRLVNEHDEEVAINEPGEMIVRPTYPWSISAGYIGNDSATAKAWRNGWFHSGDCLRRDAEGRFFFVDRIKDAVRRRGENISTAEVEAELLEHPHVLEAACVPYKAPEWIDDELKAWIVPRPGASPDFETLLRFAAERLPHFMVPRFFEITAELPKTASGRVQKFELRERGNSPETWDREAAGLVVTREGIRTSK